MQPLPKWADLAVVPLISLTLAAFVTALVIIPTGESPWFALTTMVQGALALPGASLAAAAFGAAWTAIPAWLHARRGSHIAITTIMFNSIAANLLVFMLVDVRAPSTPWTRPVPVSVPRWRCRVSSRCPDSIFSSSAPCQSISRCSSRWRWPW